MLLEIKHKLGKLQRCSGQLGSNNILATKESLGQWTLMSCCHEMPCASLCNHSSWWACYDYSQSEGKRVSLNQSLAMKPDRLYDRCNFSWHHLGITNWWQSYVHTGTFPRGMCVSMSPHLDARHAGSWGTKSTKTRAPAAVLNEHRGSSTGWWKD